MEQWKACRDFRGYEVSNYGRVREIDSGRFLSPVLSGVPQYFSVNIHPDISNKDRSKRKLVRVHRIVATEWCTGVSILVLTLGSSVLGKVRRRKVSKRLSSILV